MLIVTSIFTHIKINSQIHCSLIPYWEQTRKIFVNVKQKSSLDPETKKRIAKYDDDLQRLEKWQIGQARFP